MPGADAVSAPLDFFVDGDELHAARAIAADVRTTTAPRALWGVLIWCLPPGVRSAVGGCPGCGRACGRSAGRARRPARDGRRRAGRPRRGPPGRTAGAARPGSRTGTPA